MIRSSHFYEKLTNYLVSHTLLEASKSFNKEYKAIYAYVKKHNIPYNKEIRTGKNNPAYKHGREGTRLCVIYRNMLARCYCSNRADYAFYGARGIKVCSEWKENPEVFFVWAEEHGYKDTLTLDRIDVNGNYSPENCRWISMKEQCNNRRTNHLVAYKGKTKTLKQWSEELNINYDHLRRRLKKYSVEEAFTC